MESATLVGRLAGKIYLNVFDIRNGDVEICVVHGEGKGESLGFEFFVGFIDYLGGRKGLPGCLDLALK